MRAIIKPVIPKIAHERGYVPVTVPYRPNERDALRRALEGMKGVRYLCVESTKGRGISIWRLASEVK